MEFIMNINDLVARGSEGLDRRVSFCEALYQSGSIGFIKNAGLSFWNPVGKLTGMIVQSIPGVKPIIGLVTKCAGFLTMPCTYYPTKKMAHYKTERIIDNSLNSMTPFLTATLNEKYKQLQTHLLQVCGNFRDQENVVNQAEIGKIQFELDQLNIGSLSNRLHRKNKEIKEQLDVFTKQKTTKEVAVKKIINQAITKHWLSTTIRELSAEELAAKAALELEIASIDKKMSDCNEEIKKNTLLISEYNKSPEGQTENQKILILRSNFSRLEALSLHAADRYREIFESVPQESKGFFGSIGAVIPAIPPKSSLLITGLTAVSFAIDEEGIEEYTNDAIEFLQRTEACQKMTGMLEEVLHAQLNTQAQNKAGKGIMVGVEFVVNYIGGSYLWNSFVPWGVSALMGANATVVNDICPSNPFYPIREEEMSANPSDLISVARVVLGSGIVLMTVYKIRDQYKKYIGKQTREKEAVEVIIENGLKSLIKFVLESNDAVAGGANILAMDIAKSKALEKKEAGLGALESKVDGGIDILESKLTELINPIFRALGKEKSIKLFPRIKELMKCLSQLSPKNKKIKKIMNILKTSGVNPEPINEILGSVSNIVKKVKHVNRVIDNCLA